MLYQNGLFTIFAAILSTHSTILLTVRPDSSPVTSVDNDVSVALTALPPAVVDRRTVVCHMWLIYEAKDLYERWAVSKLTIRGLCARLEVMTTSLRDKTKDILLCQRKLLSSEATDNKLADQEIEVSKIKVYKYTLVKKLKRSAEVKKEIQVSFYAEYNILLGTNNLKYRGIVKNVNLQLAKQKLVRRGQTQDWSDRGHKSPQ